MGGHFPFLMGGHFPFLKGSHFWFLMDGHFLFLKGSQFWFLSHSLPLKGKGWGRGLKITQRTRRNCCRRRSYRPQPQPFPLRGGERLRLRSLHLRSLRLRNLHLRSLRLMSLRQKLLLPWVFLLIPPQIAATDKEGCYGRRHSPPPPSHEARTGTQWRGLRLPGKSSLDVGPQALWRSRLMLRQLVMQLLCPSGQSLLTVVWFHVACLLRYSLIILASIFLALKNSEEDVLSLTPNSWAISRWLCCSKMKRLSTVR